MAKPPRAWSLAGGRAAVVLGRSQRSLQPLSLLPVRRRASGGGAVLTGPWLLRAAVRLPRAHGLLRHGPAALARWLGGLHLGWLEAGGLAGAYLHEGPAQDHWACFAGRSMGEVLIDGRKLTGIAQTWQRSGVLASAATLMSPPPWRLLCDALGQPASEFSELVRRTASLDDLLGTSVDAPAWAARLRSALLLALDAVE